MTAVMYIFPNAYQPLAHGLLALGEAGEISGAAELLLSPVAVRAAQPLSLCAPQLP